MSTDGKRKLFSKRGSYILEATIVLPIFIAAMTALVTVIPFFTSCENIVYTPPATNLKRKTSGPIS